MSEKWSFSTEWNEHFNRNLSKTWGWTVDERIKQFLLETDTTPDFCKGKLILDAGCGNGQLTDALTSFGSKVVGIDYSTSVFEANRRKQSKKVFFVQGDLESPPFKSGVFDIIISNGVLHHTPDTHRTFNEVTRLVKEGGRFYLFLYRRPEAFMRRYILYPAIDLARLIISRLPKKPQNLAVRLYAFSILLIHRLMGKGKDITWHERVVGAYDSLTPQFRHYHTPIEVCMWFFENGFSHPLLTHWDNRYGFGILGFRIPASDTPGENFGKIEVRKRYWR